MDVEDQFRWLITLKFLHQVGGPLFKAEHYQQFIGHEDGIVLKMAVGNRRKWKGDIQSIEGETVKILVEGQEENSSEQYCES